jgi:hypothetical protein
MFQSPVASAAANRIGGDEIGKPPFPAVARFDVAAARGVIEFRLRRTYKHRLVGHLAVIDLRPRQLQGIRANLRRGIQHQQTRQAVRRDPRRLRNHHPVAMGVDEMRIDPTGFRVAGQLVHIQFARRQKHLAQLSVDHVAVDVGVVKDVVRPQRLNLRGRVVEGPPVPQPHVVEQRSMAWDPRAPPATREFDLRAAAVSPYASRVAAMCLVMYGRLDRNFAWPHIQRVENRSARTDRAITVTGRSEVSTCPQTGRRPPGPPPPCTPTAAASSPFARSNPCPPANCGPRTGVRSASGKIAPPGRARRRRPHADKARLQRRAQVQVAQIELHPRFRRSIPASVSAATTPAPSASR